MRSFSLTEFNNRSGEVVEATYTSPVGITRRGKTKFVIMTTEQYEKLRKGGDPRRVYAPDETPPASADAFAADVERLAKGEGYDD